MFCPHCGGDLPEGAGFCGICGKSVIPASQMPKKKRLSPWVFIIPGVFIVIAAIAVVILLTAKQTVYLKTETTFNRVSDGITQTIFAEYDSQGRLIARGNELDHAFRSEFTYRYNDDGQVETLRWDNGTSGMRLEYSYDQNGILEEIELTDSEEDWSLEYDIDSNGRITEFELYDTDGILVEGYTYEYDDEGHLEERILTTPYARFHYRYDEAGRCIEQVIYQNEEAYYSYHYEFNEYGHQTSSEIYYRGELSQRTNVFYKYDWKGNLFFFAISTQDGDIEATLREDDDRTIFDLSGKEVPEDSYIELVYDRAGNLTQANIYSEDTLYLQYLYDYKAVEVPQSYEAPNLTDPIWFYIQ